MRALTDDPAVLRLKSDGAWTSAPGRFPLWDITLGIPALLALLVMLALLLWPRPSHAEGGQCLWEGGPGASTYPECKLEDCQSQGGKAVCSEPDFRPEDGLNDEETDTDKYYYIDATGSQYDDASWCASAGGIWHGFDSGCWGPYSSGYLFSSVFSSVGVITESDAMSAANAYMAIKFSGTSFSLQSDTGWGYVTGFWSGTAPVLQNGKIVNDQRLLTYSTGGTSTYSIAMMRSRTLQCPQPLASRTLPNGYLQCYIPACDCQLNDPVSPVTGAVQETEADYKAGGTGGLKFNHYYNSVSRFRVPGTGVFIAGVSDYWRFSYTRHLIPISGSTTLTAIVQREDGSLESFDGSGNEILNVTGGADRLASNSSGWNLTLANGDVETYNTAGNLASIRTLSGLTTTISYGSNGLMSQVVDAFGHTLSFAYSGQNLTTVTLPDGTSTISFAYDSVLGRLVSVTYPDQTSRGYSYTDSDNSWLLTGITDESGQSYVTFTYTRGVVSQESHGAGVDTNSYTIGGPGYIAENMTYTDALNQQHQLTLTNANGATKLSYASGYCPDCPNLGGASFDANGNIQFKADLAGNQTTYVFDQTRNLELSRTEGLIGGSATAATRTTTTTWHPTLRLPSAISVYAGASASGTPLLTTGYTYDGYGNVLTKTVTDGLTGLSRTWSYTYYNSGLNGQVQTVVGPRTDITQSTAYTYNNCANGGGCGQLQSITDTTNHTTTFNSYDANGFPLSITDPNGTVTSLTYDLRQRILTRTAGGEQTSYTYYPNGLPKKITLPDGSYVLSVYDAAQRLTELDDSLGNRLVYTLDAAGNRQAEQHFDPSGNLDFTHTQLYNAIGELWQDLTAAAISTQATVYSYDANGEQTSVNAPLARTTTNSYDSLGRLTQIVDPNQGFIQYGFDALDNVTAVQDPRQLTTGYTFNGLGDLQRIQSPDSGVTQNTYDSGGNLHTSTDARGSMSTYTYDALDRVVQIAYPDQTIGFTYDQGTNGVGHLSTVVDNSGQTSFGYDPLGRVTSQQQTIGSISLSVGYSYTNANLTTVTTPSGQTITYSYNGNHQVGGVAVNGTPLITGIGYSPFGPVTVWTWGNGTQTTRTYDLDGRLTGISSAGSSSYSFFDDGSIESRSDDWQSGYSLPGGATTVNIATTSNQISNTTGTVQRTYSYDAAGHVTGYSGSTLTYNGAGRLTTVQIGNGTVTFAVNGLGERVSKTSANGTTLFVYDKIGHLLGEYNGQGQLIEETVWLDDIPVATVQPNGSGGVNVFYIHTDHLDTPRRISRSIDNAVVWRWDSDPFGAAAANEDPDGDGTLFVYNLRLPGQYFDGETGLNYNYFRDYDPVTGRYVESDPTGLDGGSYSTYAYADGDPVSNADPFGTGPVGGAIGGAIGGWIGGLAGAESGPGDAEAVAAGRAIGRAIGSYIEDVHDRPWRQKRERWKVYTRCNVTAFGTCGDCPPPNTIGGWGYGRTFGEAFANSQHDANANLGALGKRSCYPRHCQPVACFENGRKVACPKSGR